MTNFTRQPCDEGIIRAGKGTVRRAIQPAFVSGFCVIAYVTAGLAVASALVAWQTIQPGVIGREASTAGASDPARSLTGTQSSSGSGRQ